MVNTSAPTLGVITKWGKDGRNWCDFTWHQPMEISPSWSVSMSLVTDSTPTKLIAMHTWGIITNVTSVRSNMSSTKIWRNTRRMSTQIPFLDFKCYKTKNEVCWQLSPIDWNIYLFYFRVLGRWCIHHIMHFYRSSETFKLSIFLLCTIKIGNPVRSILTFNWTKALKLQWNVGCNMWCRRRDPINIFHHKTLPL